MKILFLANRFPYPPYRGDKLKIYNLARRLAKNNELFLLTFIEDRRDYVHLPALESIFKRIRLVELPKYRSAANCLLNVFSSDPVQISYFKSAEMKKALADLLEEERIDVIHTQHLRMSQYTSSAGSAKRILDLPDAYSLYWKRRSATNSSRLRKAFERSEYAKIIRYERVIREFDLTLVCSEEDREYLKKEHGADNIEILYNGVDTDTYQCEKHDYALNSQILFTGNMGYYPNIDAALYLAKEIFPEVKKKFPDVKLKIAGQNPAAKVKELSSDDVIVTGFVESLSAEYANSTVAVSPVRVGAGTMNKVLEPMAMGVPVVMSEVGFRGIGARHEKEIMLATCRDEFVKYICVLLDDENLRRSVGESGKKIVLKKFTWDSISSQLENYMKSISNGGGD